MSYFHELAMENLWTSSDQEAMEIPWKIHGEFIWAKSHGKLMGYFHELAMENLWDSSGKRHITERVEDENRRTRTCL